MATKRVDEGFGAKLYRQLAAQREAAFRRRAAFEAAQLRDRFRRGTVNQRHFTRLIRGLSTQLADNYTSLTKLHDHDYATCLRQSKHQLDDATRLTKERLKEQKALLRGIRRERTRFRYSAGNPVRTVCLSQASNIVAFTNPDTSSTRSTVTIAPAVAEPPVRFFDNRVTFSATCIAANSHFEFALLDVAIFHDFAFRPPELGMLSATASFAPVGSFALTARGDCFAPGTAVVTMGIGLRLIRVVDNALDATLGVSNGGLIVSEGASGDCGADANAGGFNFDSEAEPRSLPTEVFVGPADNLLFSCDTRIQILASQGATATLNLSSPGFGLNVPVVLVRLVS